MATCNLCPPDSRDVPDEEMDDHRRVAHPESGEDGTLQVGGSTIVRDLSTGPIPDGGSEAGEWHD